MTWVRIIWRKKLHVQYIDQTPALSAGRTCSWPLTPSLLLKQMDAFKAPPTKNQNRHKRSQQLPWSHHLGHTPSTAGTFQKKFTRRDLSGPVRDTPPNRAIPFRDSIAEGGIAPICLGFIGHRASIAEIPLLGGVSHLHFACSSWGKHSEKGEGVLHPIGHVETPKTHSAQ